MKQIFNKKGEIIVSEVPAPIAGDDQILVQVYYSCISSGTEISVLKRQGKSLIKKALEKPQNIKKVLDMIRERGLADSVSKVRNKIDARMQTGYSASGIVLEAGKNTYGFKPGDFV